VCHETWTRVLGQSAAAEGARRSRGRERLDSAAANLGHSSTPCVCLRRVGAMFGLSVCNGMLCFLMCVGHSGSLQRSAAHPHDAIMATTCRQIYLQRFAATPAATVLYFGCGGSSMRRPSLEEA
jgi:hypothetical protein